jgi:predicted phage terminase large subunit-like protein
MFGEDEPVAIADRKIDVMECEPESYYRALYNGNFFEYVKTFWSTAIAEPFVYNWHIEYLCHKLQNIAYRVAQGKPKKKDLIINVSPGSTKTALLCIFFPSWVWGFFPSASFIAASHTHPLVLRTSRLNRMVIRSEKYRAVYKDVTIMADQDAKGYFVNNSLGERMSVGIDGDITGRHSDFILVDDPINPSGARSEADILRANLFITETLDNRCKDLQVTPLILIMQRLHQNDPTGMLLDMFGEEKIEHICLPAEITSDIKPRSLRRFYRDGLMNPIRQPWKVLEHHKKKGDYYYSGQFLQSPVPLGGGMFKCERFEIDELPARKKWTRVVRYWDTASSKDRGAYTVGLKMAKNCDGRFWVLDVKRGQWGPRQRRDIMKQTAELDGHDVIVGIEQEPGGSGKETAESQAKELAGYRVRLDRPTGEKAVRADPVASQVNAGNVSLVRADWNAPFIDELTYFPDSTYKDQADAFSGAFKHLSAATIGAAVLGTF